MAFMKICPLCSNELNHERLVGVTLCECGWYDKSAEAKKTIVTDKRASVFLAISSAVLFLLYVHAATWGNHMLSVPLLRAQQVTGMLSSAGYEELALACIDVNKWSCAENAYFQAHVKSRKPDALHTLAHLQMRLGKVDAARETYTQYFKVGGKSGEAMLAYAKLLEVANDDVQAIKMYEASIEARKEILPIQATGGIVRIMMKQGRYKDAYRRIVSFHDSAENAKGYLNTELGQLKNRVGAKAGPAIERSVAGKRTGA